MSSGGWQFSVTVPSWTQASLEGDENIVVSFATPLSFATSLHLLSTLLLSPRTAAVLQSRGEGASSGGRCCAQDTQCAEALQPLHQAISTGRQFPGHCCSTSLQMASGLAAKPASYVIFFRQHALCMARPTWLAMNSMFVCKMSFSSRV